MSRKENPERVVPQPAGTTDFFELLWILVAHRSTILGVTLATTALAATYAFLQPDVFTARIRFLPPRQSQVATSAFQGIAQIAPIASVLGGSSLKKPEDTILGLLDSNRVLDPLVARLAFDEAKLKNDPGAQKGYVLKRTSNTVLKDGSIVLEIEDTKPERARRIAQAYFDILDRTLDDLNMTSAKSRRLFMEKRLEDIEIRLATAEDELLSFTTRTGLYAPEDQIRSTVNVAAELQKQLLVLETRKAMTEISLGEASAAAKSLEAERNSVVRLMARLISNVERGTTESALAAAGSDPASLAVATRRFVAETSEAWILSSGEIGLLLSLEQAMPLVLDSTRLRRNVGALEAIRRIILEQAEVARIEEGRSMEILRLIDPPVLPDVPTGPKRALITVIAAFVGFFLSATLILVRHAIRDAMSRRTVSPDRG